MTLRIWLRAFRAICFILAAALFSTVARQHVRFRVKALYRRDPYFSNAATATEV